MSASAAVRILIVNIECLFIVIQKYAEHCILRTYYMQGVSNGRQVQLKG